jgi:hypothetical protein
MNKPEEAQCIMFTQWLEMNRLKFTHIVNEVSFGALSNTPQGQLTARIQGAKLKKLGKSSGVPDYMILTPKGTVWLEMKIPSLKPKKGHWNEGWKPMQQSRAGVSRQQKDWIDAINEVPGTQADVCFGSIDAIEFVTRILNSSN